MTSRGYRTAKNRPLSDRAVRDQVLGDDSERLHAANFGVYGVRKMHRLMKRHGWLVGRDQAARVMKTLGITGVKRGKTTFTTRTKPAGSYPLDKVNRKFWATKPCHLWLADITYVATWQMWASHSVRCRRCARAQARLFRCRPGRGCLARAPPRPGCLVRPTMPRRPSLFRWQ